MTSVYTDALLTDHSLVDAAQAGSVQAFELIVDRYQARIGAYLLRETGDYELAADLTQETFLDAFRDISRVGDRSIAPWLYRIARNNLLHSWRQQRLRRIVSLEWLCGTGVEPMALCSDDETINCHERDLIQTVLATLSPALRTPLLLQSLGGLRGSEVAQVLGISPEAARQRIARAKETFRLQYSRLNGDGENDAVWSNDGGPDRLH